MGSTLALHSRALARGAKTLRYCSAFGVRRHAAVKHLGLFPSLLEYRAAGLAEVGFLPAQAGGDRLHIWDFTGTEPVNVGRAGPLLFGGCEFGERGAGCEQSEDETERQRQTGALRRSQRFIQSGIHGLLPSVRLVPMATPL